MNQIIEENDEILDRTLDVQSPNKHLNNTILEVQTEESSLITKGDLLIQKNTANESSIYDDLSSF